jgi:hypothetical protein
MAPGPRQQKGAEGLDRVGDGRGREEEGSLEKDQTGEDDGGVCQGRSRPEDRERTAMECVG